LELTPTPLGDLYTLPEDKESSRECFPIDLYLCKDCGYVHLRDVIDPDDIYPDYLYSTKTSTGLKQHFSAYAEEVFNVTKLSGDGLVVDIGSNDGTLLEVFKGYGCSVQGVDPAASVVPLALEKGVPTIVDYFNDAVADQIISERGQASIITANNVFANLDNLKSFVRSVYALLARDGAFIVEFAYLGDLMEGKIFDYIYHEHLSYFSINALESFMNQEGFRLVHLSHSGSKGGSYRAYFTKTESNMPDDQNLKLYRKQEAELKLDHTQSYTQLAESINENIRMTKQFLECVKGEGRRCVGYGASVTCTTLLYHFGIADYLECLIDDNSVKIGRLSPGYHLPVNGSDYLDKNPDVICVILAWRYADVIKSRNPHFISHGGCFVQPMPVFKVEGDN
tara:strand:+ start:1062 stop:2246 length:1185 start_codon:yes stop_codon:yes gene_type:complete